MLREFFLLGKEYIAFNKKNSYVLSLVKKCVLVSTGIKQRYVEEIYTIADEFHERLSRQDVLLPETDHLDDDTQTRINEERKQYLHHLLKKVWPV